MSVETALSLIFHDPGGRMAAQLDRSLPVVASIFGGLAVQASAETAQACLDRFASAGFRVHRRPALQPGQKPLIGSARRESLALALQLGLPHVLYCDGDRALHWAEFYPEELARAASQASAADFTVFGRTERAFESHPRSQRDTERIINHLFASTTSLHWDVTAAARGLSRRAAEYILPACPDPHISTDVSWPLCLISNGGFSLAYIEAEGLEFETPDRHADEIAAAGGLERWIAQLEASPEEWLLRLDLAQIEIQAIRDYR